MLVAEQMLCSIHPAARWWLLPDILELKPFSSCTVRPLIDMPENPVAFVLLSSLLGLHVEFAQGFVLAAAASHDMVTESFATLDADDLCAISPWYGATVKAHFVSRVYRFGYQSFEHGHVLGSRGKMWQLRTVYFVPTNRLHVFPFLLNTGGPDFTNIYMHDRSLEAIIETFSRDDWTREFEHRAEAWPYMDTPFGRLTAGYPFQGHLRNATQAIAEGKRMNLVGQDLAMAIKYADIAADFGNCTHSQHLEVFLKEAQEGTTNSNTPPLEAVHKQQLDRTC
eukprot:2188681-Amphidinium_carterae.1